MVTVTIQTLYDGASVVYLAAAIGNFIGFLIYSGEQHFAKLRNGSFGCEVAAAFEGVAMATDLPGLEVTLKVRVDHV